MRCDKCQTFHLHWNSNWVFKWRLIMCRMCCHYEKMTPNYTTGNLSFQQGIDLRQRKERSFLTANKIKINCIWLFTMYVVSIHLHICLSRFTFLRLFQSKGICLAYLICKSFPLNSFQCQLLCKTWVQKSCRKDNPAKCFRSNCKSLRAREKRKCLAWGELLRVEPPLWTKIP